MAGHEKVEELLKSFSERLDEILEDAGGGPNFAELRDLFRLIQSKQSAVLLDSTDADKPSDRAPPTPGPPTDGNHRLTIISSDLDHVNVYSTDPRSFLHEVGAQDRSSCCLSINSRLLGDYPPKKNYEPAPPCHVLVNRRGGHSIPWSLRTNRYHRQRSSSSTPDILEPFDVERHCSYCSTRSFSRSPSQSLSSQGSYKASKPPLVKDCSVVVKKMKVDELLRGAEKSHDCQVTTIKQEPLPDDEEGAKTTADNKAETLSRDFVETETQVKCYRNESPPPLIPMFNYVTDLGEGVVFDNEATPTATEFKDWSEFEMDLKGRNNTETVTVYNTYHLVDVDSKEEPDELPDKIYCTSCQREMFWKEETIFKHNILDVITCQRCYTVYNDGSFTVGDDNHEDYCMLCGDGGDLVLCDKCPKSCCKSCIHNICGTEYINHLMNDNLEVEWNCWSCDPSPLEKQKKLCRLFTETLNRRKRKRKRKNNETQRIQLPNHDNRKYKSKEIISSEDELSPNQDKVVPSPPPEDNNNLFQTNDDIVNSDSSKNIREDFPGSERKRFNQSSKEAKVSTGDKNTIDIVNIVTTESDSDVPLGGGRKGRGLKRVSIDGSLLGSCSDSGNNTDVASCDKSHDTDRKSHDERKAGAVKKEKTEEGGVSKSKKIVRERNKRENLKNFTSDSSNTDISSVSLSDEDIFFSSHRKKRNLKKKLREDKKRPSSGSGSRKTPRYHVGRSEFGIETFNNQESEEGEGQLDMEDMPTKDHALAKGNALAEGDEMGAALEEEPTTSTKGKGDHRKGKRKFSSLRVDASDRKRSPSKKSNKDKTKKENSAKVDQDLLDFLKSSDDESRSSIVLTSPSPSPLNKSFPKRPHRRLSDDEFLVHRKSSSDSDIEVSARKPKKLRKTSAGSGHSSCSNDKGAPSDESEFEGERRYGAYRRQALKVKKRNRRRNLFSSDSSEVEEMEEGVKDEEGKYEEDSSDVEISEIKNTPNKRKNIRKLISKDKLAGETKEAQKAEKERLDRLKKKNKLKNKEESDKRIILAENPDTKEVLLEIRHSLVPKLLPHQVKGINFLYDCCCEDLDHLKTEPGSGALLAHCMGLGKTLQVVALLDALLSNEDIATIERVIVLCPVNTLLNWKDEWNKWVSFTIRDYHVYVVNEKTNNRRLSMMEKWFKYGGVLLMGYEMYRTLAQGKKIKKHQQKELFHKYLLDPGPHIIVCDEGHVLRQEKSNLSLVLNQIATKRRIVLTGTPLQNNLKEYYTMVNFIKPNLLGTFKEFSNRFINPITNGQCADSKPMDVRIMKQRAHILFQLLSGCVDRKDYRILAESLPPKYEYVISVRMTPIQEELIKRYLERNNGYHTAADLFSTFANLVKVWNHPWVLMLDQDRKDFQKEKELDDDFIDDNDSLEGFIVNIDDSNDSDEDEYLVKKKEQLSRESSAAPSPNTSSVASNWFEDLLPDECATKLELSGKLLFLIELLKETTKVREKVLVFSQSLLILDLIEDMIQQPQYGNYIEGINYFRLDGSTKASDRTDLMKKFNKANSDNVHLFLISTRAGSLGVNLVGANRVVVFDACWNPTHDLQSIFRSYRFGQTKPVFVYRLLAQGTMEEKIYDRQVTKTSLSLRVIDEKQIGRHYTFSQLQELFTFTPAPPPSGTTPRENYDRPSSDIVFCKILDKLQPHAIIKYHTHDSLLEHIFDEELTEEERKAAWENYNLHKEMESRAYNIGINLQQQQQVGLEENQVMPLIATNPSTNRILAQTLYTKSAFHLIQQGLNTANDAKNAIDLRNHIVPQLGTNPSLALVQRYKMACTILEAKIKELYPQIPKIKDILAQQALWSMSIDDRRNLEVLRLKFLHKLKEIDEGTKIHAPDPTNLPVLPGTPR